MLSKSQIPKFLALIYFTTGLETISMKPFLCNYFYAAISVKYSCPHSIWHILRFIKLLQFINDFKMRGPYASLTQPVGPMACHWRVLVQLR